MANAPIHKQLQEYGLSPVHWSEDYLDILPAYRDVTSPVVCHVAGAEQGLERLARMTMVGAAKSDAPISGSFEEGEDDDLRADYFVFDHITSEWHCARILTERGHRYVIIVRESEKQELDALQEEHYPLRSLGQAPISAVLSRIERQHVIKPSRRGQKTTRSFYVRSRQGDYVYGVSSFVVARAVDRERVLVLNTLTQLGRIWDRVHLSVLATLGVRAMRATRIRSKLEHAGDVFSLDETIAACEALREAGILVACGRPGHYTNPISAIGPAIEPEAASVGVAIARDLIAAKSLIRKAPVTTN
jgi:hypothetical protein